MFFFFENKSFSRPKATPVDGPNRALRTKSTQRKRGIAFKRREFASALASCTKTGVRRGSGLSRRVLCRTIFGVIAAVDASAPFASPGNALCLIQFPPEFRSRAVAAEFARNAFKLFRVWRARLWKVRRRARPPRTRGSSPIDTGNYSTAVHCGVLTTRPLSIFDGKRKTAPPSPSAVRVTRRIQDRPPILDDGVVKFAVIGGNVNKNRTVYDRYLRCPEQMHFFFFYGTACVRTTQ